MDIGQVCVKLAGRETGKKCVVVDVVDESYVLVSGPEVKRRRCNVGHLEPLEQKLEIKKGASDKVIERAFASIGEVKPERPVRRKPPKKEPLEKPPKKKARKGTKRGPGRKAR